MNRFLYTIRKNIYIIPLSIALSIFLNIIINLTSIVSMDQKFIEASKNLYAYGDIGRIFLILIFAPIVEELIYRWAIFKVIRRRLRFIYVALISSFIFGIVHMNITQFIYAFLMGLVFSYAYELTGYIIVPMIMHIIANFTINYIYGYIGLSRENIYYTCFILIICIAIIYMSFYRWLQENKTGFLAILSRK